MVPPCFPFCAVTKWLTKNVTCSYVSAYYLLQQSCSGGKFNTISELRGLTAGDPHSLAENIVLLCTFYAFLIYCHDRQFNKECQGGKLQNLFNQIILLCRYPDKSTSESLHKYILAVPDILLHSGTFQRRVPCRLHGL